MSKVFLLIAVSLLSISLYSQNINFVKDSIMNEYMESGVSDKEFMPEGQKDYYGNRQGFWTDYEVKYDMAFVFIEGLPKNVFGHFLIYGEGNYKDNKRTGEWMFYTIEDSTFNKLPFKKLAFSRGIPIGEVTYFYPDSNIAFVGKYKKGHFSGTFTGYFPNGKTASKYYYKNGMRNGECINYYESGQIRKRLPFKEDHLSGKYTTYYPNGQVEIICFYLNNEVHGSYKYFHPNGQLWTERIYENDKTMEVTCNYDENGVSRDAGTLKNGNGTMILYDREGKVYSVRTYKNGDLSESEDVEGFEFE